MKFLIDEDLPRSTSILIQKYGYEAIDVRDVGLRGSTDAQIASYARNRNLCLVTGDFDFSDGKGFTKEASEFGDFGTDFAA